MPFLFLFPIQNIIICVHKGKWFIKYIVLNYLHSDLCICKSSSHTYNAQRFNFIIPLMFKHFNDRFFIHYLHIEWPLNHFSFISYIIYVCVCTCIVNVVCMCNVCVCMFHTSYILYVVCMCVVCMCVIFFLLCVSV